MYNVHFTQIACDFVCLGLNLFIFNVDKIKWSFDSLQLYPRKSTQINAFLNFAYRIGVYFPS